MHRRPDGDEEAQVDKIGQTITGSSHQVDVYPSIQLIFPTPGLVALLKGKLALTQEHTRIIVEFTPPGAQQFNGKVERRQTDLVHKALAGMHQANLSEATRKAL